MSVAALTAVTGTALVLLAVVLNHVHARLALVEVALNEGLPPGHGRQRPTSTHPSPATTADRLGSGLHIFLSRSCHACQRLIEELESAPAALTGSVVLYYVDRPRPIAAAAAAALGAELRSNQGELAGAVAADTLPYTIAVGPLGLVARRVTPSVRDVLDVACDAALAPQPGQRAQ